MRLSTVHLPEMPERIIIPLEPLAASRADLHYPHSEVVLVVPFNITSASVDLAASNMRATKFIGADPDGLQHVGWQ